MPNVIYETEPDDNAEKITQGDIFYNLPLLNTDLLIKATANEKKSLEDESNTIFQDIMEKKRPILVESFIVPSIGILASQNCDIRPNRNLIFYPLIKTDPPYKSSNIEKFIKDNIVKATRTHYLPKILKDKIENGPFNVIYSKPFTVSYDVILENYHSCWFARMIEPARRVFIGKLTEFFSRTPIEEIIYLENNEITLLFQQIWSNTWKKGGVTSSKIEEIVLKIEEVKRVLTYVERERDFNEIKFFDCILIQKIQDKINVISFGKYQKVITLCDELLEESITNFGGKFESILNKVFLKLDSILVKWKDPEIIDALQKVIEEGEFHDLILPEKLRNENKTDIKQCGVKIRSALKWLQKTELLIPSYKRIFEFC